MLHCSSIESAWPKRVMIIFSTFNIIKVSPLKISLLRKKLFISPSANSWNYNFMINIFLTPQTFSRKQNIIMLCWIISIWDCVARWGLFDLALIVVQKEPRNSIILRRKCWISPHCLCVLWFSEHWTFSMYRHKVTTIFSLLINFQFQGLSMSFLPKWSSSKIKLSSYTYPILFPLQFSFKNTEAVPISEKNNLEW